MAHEKTKESDLNRALRLTTAAVLKERDNSLSRCGLEEANGIGMSLLQVSHTEDFIF